MPIKNILHIHFFGLFSGCCKNDNSLRLKFYNLTIDGVYNRSFEHCESVSYSVCLVLFPICAAISTHLANKLLADV
jgi:hypothetical protein